MNDLKLLQHRGNHYSQVIRDHESQIDALCSRHCFYAVLHGLRADGILGLGPAALRSLAVGGLHGVPRFSVYRPADYYRPILFSENRCEVPGLANEKSSYMDGYHHVDYTGTSILHQHFRLGTLRWLQRPASWSMRRPVPERSSLQHCPHYRLLLDYPDSAFYPLWRDIQDGLRHAEKK